MKEVEIREGRIQYRDEGQGPTLVFLHGAFSNANTWRKVIGPLSKNYRCVVPNLPLGGHALPMAKEADLTPPGIAEILKKTVEAIGINDFILIGNDTGGAYAQVFASLYPEKLLGLVLSNTDAFEIFPPPQFSLTQKAIALPGVTFLMAQAFRMKWFLKSNLALGLLSNSLSGNEMRELFVNDFISSGRIRADCRKMFLGLSPVHTLTAAKTLTSFTKPVLILWGLDDVLFPRSLGERVHAIFPNAQWQTVASSMTYVQEDQPEQFITKMTDFLSGTFPLTDKAEAIAIK